MKFITKNKELILQIIIVILVIVLFYYLSQKSKENFELKYVINSENNEKKAVTYNIDKYVIMSNNLGNALKFDGSSSYIFIPDINYLTYTISFLANFSTLNTNMCLLYSNYDNTLLELKYIDKKLILEVNNNGVIDKLESTYDLKSSIYNHIAITYSNNKLELFINGDKVEKTVNYSITINNLIIGKNQSLFFNGYIGQINVFNSVKSNTELCNMYNLCDKEEIVEDIPQQVSQEQTTTSQECVLPTCGWIAQGDTEFQCLQECGKSKGCTSVDCADICSKCKSPDLCKWIKREDPSCKFIPYGRDKYSCIDKCMLANNCDFKSCQSICNSCTDSITCPWVKQEETIDLPTFNDEPDEKIHPEGNPSPPFISNIIQYKSIKLEWERPRNQGDTPIVSYMIFLYKTFNKNEGITISELRDEGIRNYFIINNLEPETTYSVGVRAKNQNGLSHMSNILTFKPNVDNNLMQEFVPEKTDDEPSYPLDSNYKICN